MLTLVDKNTNIISRKLRIKKFLFIFMIFLLLAISMLILSFETDIFNVSTVSVIGNTSILEEDIVGLMGISNNDNILLLDREMLKVKIESNPYIKVVSIEIKLPDQLIINVEEREKACIISYMGAYVVSDSQGRVLEVTKEIKDIEYPLIRGLEVLSVDTGELIRVSRSEQLEDLELILNTLEHYQCSEYISEIIIEDKNNIEIITSDGIKITAGSLIDITNKIGILKVTLENLREQNIYGGYLDISIEGQAIYKPYLE